LRSFCDERCNIYTDGWCVSNQLKIKIIEQSGRCIGGGIAPYWENNCREALREGTNRKRRELLGRDIFGMMETE